MLLAIMLGALMMSDSNKNIDTFDKINMLKAQPILPIKIVPNIISRIVLPFDIFTKNVPTIGANANHQAQ
jgi:hypothetical protein